MTIESLTGMSVIENRRLRTGQVLRVWNSRTLRDELIVSHAYAFRVRIELHNWLRDRVAETNRRLFG